LLENRHKNGWNCFLRGLIHPKVGYSILVFLFSYLLILATVYVPFCLSSWILNAVKAYTCLSVQYLLFLATVYLSVCLAISCPWRQFTCLSVQLFPVPVYRIPVCLSSFLLFLATVYLSVCSYHLLATYTFLSVQLSPVHGYSSWLQCACLSVLLFPVCSCLQYTCLSVQLSQIPDYSTAVCLSVCPVISSTWLQYTWCLYSYLLFLSTVYLSVCLVISCSWLRVCLPVCPVISCSWGYNIPVCLSSYLLFLELQYTCLSVQLFPVPG
jgi:hypothetical protein